MSENLEPRKVNIRDIPVWVSESWCLLWRKPFLFLATSFIYHLIALSTRSIPFFSTLLSILVCYIVLLVLIKFAEATDFTKKIKLNPTYLMIRKVILCLLLLTVIYFCIYFVSAIVISFLAFDIPAVDYSDRKLYTALKWVWPGEISFMILFMGTIATSMWFLAPLLSLHDLNIRDARALAKRANQKNEIVILVASHVPFFGIIALTLVTEASLLLSLLFVPYFGIFQYVSYRHVFLGGKENKPIPAKVSTSEIPNAVANQNFLLN